MKHYKEKYDEWLKSPYIDQNTKAELMKIEENEKEIEDRFYKDLQFGTGGLRGVIGAGTNRMNIYTVGKATQGLANYILKLSPEYASRGVAIAYDSRNQSLEFAQRAAEVLKGNGIKVYFFHGLRPTPELSFTVREEQCIAGIVITASHNPAEYNGFKVYWEDGGQIVQQAEGITVEIDAVEGFDQIKLPGARETVTEGTTVWLGEGMDERYYDAVQKEVINRDVIDQMADQLKIVYTPIHGAGNKPVREVLQRIGFKSVYVVKEQEQPDAAFPTVKCPNPEDPQVFDLAIKQAKELDADLIMGTDPDGDRAGVLVKDNSGEFVVLTGNQLGCLLAEYIFSQKSERGQLPSNAAMVKTIVTSEMAQKIASHYNVELFNVLTGFKYIGEKILEFEKSGSHQFVFGFEESYGALAGDQVRDKDAVMSCMLVAEMAAWYKYRKTSLYQALNDLYIQYGYYRDTLKTITLEGKGGMEKINEIVQCYRQNHSKIVAGREVQQKKDYLKSMAYHYELNRGNTIELPKSNVVAYTFKDQSSVVIRPSGTEPKLKIYLSATALTESEALENLNGIRSSILGEIKEIMDGGASRSSG